MPSEKMMPLERRAVFSLATIMSLRMLALFMALPLFTLYASGLAGATPFLVGLCVGIYGLTQALLQIPFGACSDRMGRKKIILIGLLIFAVGSVISASAHTIEWLLVGRALQGGGAIGSTLLALLSDLTRHEQRTKAMAISGMAIGMAFSVAMMLGPFLGSWFDVSGIFYLAAFLSVLGIFLLFIWVPKEPPISARLDTSRGFKKIAKLFSHRDLMRLNTGIFLLHAIFTASFVVIPITLKNSAGLQSNQQWWLYLPVLTMAFCATLPCIIIAEKKRLLKTFFIGAIMTLGVAEFLLWIFSDSLLISGLNLLLFFTAFSLLEASLPSLVSRTAPSDQKGAALGIYSCSQFFGIFIGGATAGWLYGQYGLTEVYLFCAILTVFWLTIAFKMKNPQYATTSQS